jgi:hypothetical protein
MSTERTLRPKVIEISPPIPENVDMECLSKQVQEAFVKLFITHGTNVGLKSQAAHFTNYIKGSPLAETLAELAFAGYKRVSGRIHPIVNKRDAPLGRYIIANESSTNNIHIIAFGHVPDQNIVQQWLASSQKKYQSAAGIGVFLYVNSIIIQKIVI